MADNLNEANKNAENLRQTLGDILFEQRSLADEARKFTKEVFDSNLQGQSAAKAFRDIANSTRDINREMGDILAGEKAYDDLQKDITKQKTAQKALEVEAIQALTQMGYGYDSINSCIFFLLENCLYAYIYISTLQSNYTHINMTHLSQPPPDMSLIGEVCNSPGLAEIAGLLADCG